MIKPPPRLQRGDTLMAVSLSWGGPGAFPLRYQQGKRQLEETFGVRVVESRHALRDPDWLARNPAARADDFMEAFADPSVHGIVSTIGGDDSIRLLRHLRRDAITPKVFLGYSDTTVTHFFLQQCGIVSFYGPSIMAGFGETGGMFPYTIDSVRRTLFEATPIGVIEPNRSGWTSEFVDWSHDRPRALNAPSHWRWLQGEGIVEGPLVGGCLEVMEFLRGTGVWPDFTNAILFFETSEEAPPASVVARALRSYAAMGMLHKVAAVLAGRPVKDADTHDDAILGVIREEEGLTIPVITQMDFGHTDPMFVLPLGVRARIDCERREFSIVESAVSE